MNVQQFQIFTKKFQFNKFFTKAVKKVLVDAFGDKAHFNFEATQNVLLPSRKGGDEMSGVRPFPFKMNIAETSGCIYIDGRGMDSMVTVMPEHWEELPEEAVEHITNYVDKLLSSIESKEDGSKPTINIEVCVNLDSRNYAAMNDPESLKLVRELEGTSKPSKQNELHKIADKITKEGVNPEVVTKIVEIVLATLPLVMKK
jgi:hypothetical protein|nr:MAG TPA: hypothetical protein [Caudoviricetes sp.]